ncbi:hypothetical protein, partial [Brucella intermedia]|uniref:hypothetical protein n=1 Tax=Brucella intermedia TaxID=94625 RepID=UPI001AED2986
QEGQSGSGSSLTMWVQSEPNWPQVHRSFGLSVRFLPDLVPTPNDGHDMQDDVMDAVFRRN